VNKIRYYSNFIMVAIYVSLGLLFLFTDIADELFPAYRKPVGITLLVYAIMRTYLIIKKIKEEENDWN
jgi:hypothetical protein